MKRKRDRTKIKRVGTENTGRHKKKDMGNVICLHLVVKGGKVHRKVTVLVTGRLVNSTSMLKYF
jgi:hypothetical protein